MKKDQKIAQISLFQGGQRKIRPKNSKKKKRKLALLSLYLLYHISIPYMKIQGVHGPLC